MPSIIVQPPPIPKAALSRPLRITPDYPVVEPLDLKLLTDLPSLPIRARYVMESYLSGIHRSLIKGFSVEFTEYRAYQPGDELKRIDWRYYGRSDRLCIKQYEEETQMRVHLALDASASMAFRGAPQRLTKLDYARTLLAALAFLGQRQRDASSLAVLGDHSLRSFLRPRASLAHLHAILSRLSSSQVNPQPDANPGIHSALEELSRLIRRRSIVVIASDFYDNLTSLEQVIRRLRYDHHEVIALHVLDPLEIDFSWDAAGSFVDLETGLGLDIDANAARSIYLKEFGQFRSQLRELLLDWGGDYVLMRTDESPFPALTSYLAQHRRLL